MTTTKEEALKHLSKLAGSRVISDAGPGTDELWNVFCEYLKSGVVEPEDFKDWKQILVHSRVAGKKLHECARKDQDTDGGEDDSPSAPEQEDDIIEPKPEEEENNMENDDRLKSRVAEESEDDESYWEAIDRILINNTKSITDMYATLFGALAATALVDLQRERVRADRDETRRLKHEDEERQMRLRQTEAMFEKRMLHQEEEYTSRKNHQNLAVAQQWRDQARDNYPADVQYVLGHDANTDNEVD